MYDFIGADKVMRPDFSICSKLFLCFEMLWEHKLARMTNSQWKMILFFKDQQAQGAFVSKQVGGCKEFLSQTWQQHFIFVETFQTANWSIISHPAPADTLWAPETGHRHELKLLFQCVCPRRRLKQMPEATSADSSRGAAALLRAPLGSPSFSLYL